MNRFCSRSLGLVLFSVFLAGCPIGDSGNVGDEFSAKDGVQISGYPTTEIPQSFLYKFVPKVVDVDTSQALEFSIENQPSWATFDPATGTLEGTPRPDHVGTYERIEIVVRNGGSAAKLEPFDIDVTHRGNGVAVVSWTRPTTNADGTPLQDLSGFKIYYGENPNQYSRVIDIADPGLTSFAIEGLPPGIYYFVTTAYDIEGAESDYSNIASKTIS